MSVNIGSPGEFTGQRLTYSPSGGDVHETTYEGTLQFVHALYSAFTAQGYPCTCDTKAGKCSVTIKGSNDGVESQQTSGVEIEMHINAVYKDLFEPWLGGPYDITEDDLRLVKKALESNSLDDKLALLPDLLTGQLGVSDDAYTLFKLGLLGVRHRRVDQPNLTRVTTAGRLHKFPNAYQNVGRNLTEAQMRAEMGVPFAFDLPVFNEAVKAGFSYGWIKQMPSYTQVVGQRVSETVTYEFGVWSSFLHPDAT